MIRAPFRSGIPGATRGARPALITRVLSGLGLMAAVALMAAGAHAATGSYATTGTGTYAQSLWWLDFSTYSDTTAQSASGQTITFTLPNNAGTLTTTVKRTGSGTLITLPEPSWAGGGAIGHGAYNGITGSPNFYWNGQTGIGTVQLSALSVKDAAGNARSFAVFAADGENTNNGESIVYATSGVWQLLDMVNYFAGYNGGTPVLTGVGSASVTESAPTSNDNTENASIVLGSQSPTQVSAALNGNEAVLFAVALPTVKWNLNVTARAGSADQFNLAVGYTNPASSLKTAATTGTGLTASTAAVSAIAANSVTMSVSMATGSSSPLSYYTSSVSCTNSGPGPSAFGGTTTVLPTGAGTSFAVTPQTGDAITCTLTLTPVGITVTGTVYADSNHNADLDTSETGTGISGLYVKLAPSSSGVCQSPASSAVAVTAASGAYTLSNVTPGSYCLIMSNNTTLTSITPYLPPGWIGTEGGGVARQLTTSASPAPVQNFGLYNGSQLNVVVFSDTGSGGGTANDGVQNGGESGMANLAVTATVGGTVVTSTTSNSTGSAVLWLPATTSGTVTLGTTLPAGFLATGGSAGTTTGTYSRPAVTFTFASGNAYTGITFGVIPPGSFTSNGTQTTQPGAVVIYPHTFIAGSAGQVTFTTTAVSGPHIGGWTEVLYVDAGCTGQLANSDVAITAAVTVTAGQRVCILQKETAPSGAPPNAQNTVTVNAGMTFSGAAAPAIQNLNDVDTTLVAAGAVSFTKQVQNVTLAGAYSTGNTAAPGNTLQYQLTVVNQGSAPLTALMVNDATPGFTTFLSAACPTALPTGMSACTLNTVPATGAQGALQWKFTGSLQPAAQVVVTYQVLVSQ